MTNKIRNLLKDVLGKILQNDNTSTFRFLKSLENVSIANSHTISPDAGLQISYQLKKLVIGENVGCRKFCNFLVYPNASLIIGNDVYFNSNCSVNCLGEISIGDGTLFGEGVKMYDHNHAYGYEGKELKVSREEFTIGKITIGRNCWIGSNVTILNNVEIGDNVIIGANCLIFKSVPANSIVKHKEELIVTSV